MKLVAWNCQGAYRRKARPVANFRPDIAVISECESPERLRFERGVHAPASVAWFGDSPAKKGIGIFSYTGLRFELYERYDPSIQYCIPLRVLGGPPLHLLAVWAMPHRDRRHSYVGQLHLALEAYGPFIRACDSVLMGDFNSSTVFDRKHRANTHSALVERLAADAFVSLYHHRSGDAHGRERRPTWYLYRREEFVYHLDYCFVPQAWLPRLAAFRLGSRAHYSRYSDHCPLFARFF
jgi:hypothetical protein